VEHTDVVVVGAGAAGLACARELARHGVDAVVLEARPRSGGRILTHRRTTGVVELGAQVVHATADSALATLVADAGLAVAPLARDAEVVVVGDGRRWDAVTLTRQHPPPPWAVEVLGPGSVADSLSGLSHTPRALAELWLEQSVGGDTLSLEADGVAAVATARGGGDEQVLVDGFDAVTEALAVGLDVRLDCPVTTLTWSEGRVVVQGTTQVSARAVVVTVPPSVVLAGGVTFDPPLPVDKRAELPALASVDAVTVVVTVREPAKRSTWALLAEEPWGLWHSTTGSPFVVGHVKGPRAAAARRVDWSVSNVGWLLRQVDESLGGVVDVLVHDWGRDPWACGAHTAPVFGVDRAAASWATPLASTVFFAGEATAGLSGRGLVQGALSSGQRAATEVVLALGHR
jgi:monoamine oxidase